MYHPNCHCKERSINIPRLNDIEVLDVRSNFNDFFKRKKGVFYGIGYTPSDEMQKCYTTKYKKYDFRFR